MSIQPGARPLGVGGGGVTWARAYAWAAVILVGFFLATVWLPELLLGLLRSSDQLVQDAVVSIVWTGAVVASLWTVRSLQRRGKI